MSLLYMESFDHYDGNPVGHKWSVATGLASIQSSVARTGTRALNLANAGNESVTKPVVATGFGIVAGFATRFSSFSGGGDWFHIREGAATNHLTLNISAAGILAIKRGATILGTSVTPLIVNSWHYIEIKALIDDVNGNYEVRIDGITDANLTNAGPVDTRNAGATGQWDRLSFFSIQSPHYVDDLYILDLNGGAPRNTFLGAAKIELLMPQTDAVAAGSNAGLTPSTGTDHGTLVDEIPPNTTDYNSSPTVGLKDTYQLPSMTLTGTVFGIQTNLYVAKSDAAARQVCAVIRSGGTDFDGANISPGTSFAYFAEIRPVNPNGSVEWTTAAIATLEAGMKVTV